MGEYCYDVGGRIYCDDEEEIIEEFGELIGVRKEILEKLMEIGVCEDIEECYEWLMWR